MIFIFYSFASAFLATFVLLPLLINYLTKQNLLDIGGRRKIHKGFIPSMGGVAIFLGFLFAAMVWIPVRDLSFFRYFLAASGILFITGMRDDLVALSPRGKLVMQLLASSMVVWGGGSEMGIRIENLGGFLGIYELPLAISYSVSIFAIIVVTNAFNLIDGLDGLAGSVGLAAFTILACWFLLVGEEQSRSWTMALLLIAFSGAIVAFLCYNWQPASIFMGDTGSLLLGFVMAIGLLKFIQINGNPDFVSDYKINAPLSVGFGLAIIPLFDTGRIFLLRIIQGRSPFSPDKLHIHHLLMRMGLTHAQVTFTIVGLYIVLISGMYLLSLKLSDNIVIPIFVAICVGLHFLLSYLIDVVFDKKKRKVNNFVESQGN
ncbi:MAG: MraY family glycosyltransferase [Bacteroidales bacterium]